MSTGGSIPPCRTKGLEAHLRPGALSMCSGVRVPKLDGSTPDSAGCTASALSIHRGGGRPPSHLCGGRSSAGIHASRAAGPTPARRTSGKKTRSGRPAESRAASRKPPSAVPQDIAAGPRAATAGQRPAPHALPVPPVRRPDPRQKTPAPFRFRGLRKSRESCTSAGAFFLSESNPLRRASIRFYATGSPERRCNSGALYNLLRCRILFAS